jgi:hypothetical protein
MAGLEREAMTGKLDPKAAIVLVVAGDPCSN